MLRFKFQGIVPPGGRYFINGDLVDGLTFSHPDRAKALAQVTAYLLQNKREVPSNLNEILEDCVCRQVPIGFCEGPDDGRPRKRVVSLKDIREKTLALVSSTSYADPGVAKERAVICAQCKLNDRSACPTCTGLIAWGARAIGNRTVPGYSDILGICELDGCLMAAGIFAKSMEGVPEAPANCWRGKQ